MTYDPVKAHEYYIRTRKLKGRRSRIEVNNTLKRVGSTKVNNGNNRPRRAPTPEEKKAVARARVLRLTQKLKKLQNALQEATKELRIKRQAEQRSRETARKTEKKNSDGKTTAKERAASKKYRDTHKAEIASKRNSASSSGGSSSGSSSKKKSVSDMSISELTDRISNIKSAISNAKKQIKEANSLSHSQFVDNTNYLVHDGIERPLTLN